MISIGIDTGANTAWAIVDVPARQIERPKVLAVGMFAREDRPGQLMEHIQAGYDFGYAIGCIGIEHAPKMYQRARFGAHMASCIGEGNAIARELANEAKHAGHTAILVTAAEWRKELIGNARAKTPMIARWVALATLGTGFGAAIGIKTNQHTRDAIGVAIYAARRAMRAIAQEESV